MSAKFQRSWKKWLPLLAGFLIVLVSFRKIVLTNEEQIKKGLKGTGLERFSPFFIAMAKHESGNFTNNLAKKYNNVFSMGFPSVRPSVNAGFAFLDGSGFKWSKYSDVTQATKDLVKWFEYNGFNKNQNIDLPGFISWLKSRNYFEDSYFNYYNGVNRFLKNG